MVPTKRGPQHSIVVVTGPVSGTGRILTHELIHAEMKTWVPYHALPTWFDEGMATFIANEPNCDGHPPAETPDTARLDTKTAWEEHLREHHDTLAVYCQSRHRVAAWAARFSGERERAAALKALMTSVLRARIRAVGARERSHSIRRERCALRCGVPATMVRIHDTSLAVSARRAVFQEGALDRKSG